MNCIIHPCSHPNDNDPHFRITEAEIFKNIFSYIEVPYFVTALIVITLQVEYMSLSGISRKFINLSYFQRHSFIMESSIVHSFS